MATRKRSGSGSKRHLKEKVVQIYESFFRGEDLTTDNATFWDEFFLLKPKIPQLEAEIHKLSVEQLMSMRESMNLLVSQCIEMLGQEHHIRLVYALQTLSALLITMYQRAGQDPNINIKTILIGSDNPDFKMQKLFEHCSTILSGDVPDSLKSMVLKLLLVIATGIDNIDDNSLVEYFMQNSLFEPLIQLLCTSTERQHHGYDVVMLLMFLVNYKKQESANPYVVKLSILDDELALNGYGQVITAALNDYVMSTFGGMQGGGGGGGWLSSLTSMVGGIFLTSDETQPVVRGQRNRYKELFSGGLGRYTGGKATLRVREGATPVFHRARPVPYALLSRLDAALDAMLHDGIIEPVDCSDWASPLVPVNKPDGSLRICADYKATLNPVLITDRYPLPRIEDLLVKLSGASYFSKIDLTQAYNQIELDDSKEYTVINTHRGLYRYNRLVFGLSSSPGIFQRIMCNLLKGIPNVEIFLDDIIIAGKTQQEHLEALEKVLSKLHQYGLKLKSNKCVFLVKEIKYLGYVISKEGIKTDPSKVEAITNIPRPTNITELRSFLGIINFYGKFVRNMSSRLLPLYELLKKSKQWDWTADCEQSFVEIKKVLAGAQVLAHYEPSKQLILTCDASARGIGGVLTQPGERGERPVAYASRTLTEAEKNYSQIHREALAIIFCVNKFHQYLYGRNFILRTDHKPLVSIFGPNTGIPTMVASRMQRWAIILSAYSFTIEYVRTDQNGADGFSRLPVVGKQTSMVEPPEQTHLHFVQQSLLLDYNDIKRQTLRDVELSKILSYVRDGWPKDCELSNLKPYFNRKDELYEELGCIMWGHRLVVPETCRDKVLLLLHEPHMGIVKSKALARSYVWWPGVDEAVERMCRGCETCAAQADAPPRQAPRMWAWPNRPWSRLHIDYLGPIGGRTYLVVVDATSKWLEVFNVSNTSAYNLIDRLMELFSRWGLPRQIVSDNGTQFASKEFQEFTKTNGIEHIFTAPYHPASNGLAENSVRTVKKVIKKAMLEKQNIDRAIWTFLLHYRNIEHSTTGESPSMILLGRHIRTRLDIIKPDRQNRVHKAQQRQVENAEGGKRSIGGEGADVWYRQFLKGERWLPGQVVECLGPSNYRVKGGGGETVHRHIDQLRRRTGGRLSLVASGPSNVERSHTDSQAMSAESMTGSSCERTEAEGSADRGGPLSGEASPSQLTAEPEEPSEIQVALPQAPPTPQRAVRTCRLKNINYRF